MRAALSQLERCSGSLQSDVGEPPAGRLLSVYRPMADACRGLEETARLLTKYFGLEDASGIWRNWRIKEEAEIALSRAEASARSPERELASAAR